MHGRRVVDSDEDVPPALVVEPVHAEFSERRHVISAKACRLRAAAPQRDRKETLDLCVAAIDAQRCRLVVHQNPDLAGVPWRLRVGKQILDRIGTAARPVQQREGGGQRHEGETASGRGFHRMLEA
jgi:hypothetical protein